jgi:hypothetical protein
MSRFLEKTFSAIFMLTCLPPNNLVTKKRGFPSLNPGKGIHKPFLTAVAKAAA